MIARQLRSSPGLHRPIESTISSVERRTLRFFLTIPVLFFLIFAVWGCGNDTLVQRSVVSGIVLDTGGNRIAGARITSHRSLYEAMTGDDGKYAFTSLDSGSHRLLVERAGYESASRTLSVESGNVQEHIDFRLAPLDNRLSWHIFKRTQEVVMIDVSAKEPMVCTAVWQGEHLPQMRTAPSALSVEHRFEIVVPRPEISYLLFIEGKTADGRTYLSATGTFRPVPVGDIPGAPPEPVQVVISQTREGPKLSWNYEGIDRLQGFRIYRGVEDKALSLWQEESFVFAAQRFLIDDLAEPGVRVRYALEAVDLDGNTSSRTADVPFIPAGVLQRNVTWKSSWSSVDVYGDIQVPERWALTIEPGLIVRVSPTDAAQGGLDPLKCEFIIDGRLIAGASGTSPVQFLAATSRPTRDNWSGIRLRTIRSIEGSELENVIISNAEIGVLAQDAPFTIGHFESRYCETGMWLQGASGTILTGMTAVDCGTGFIAESTLGCSLYDVRCLGGDVGISLRGNRSLTLRDFDVRDVSDTALELADTASPTVLRGVMTSKRLGMDVRGGSGRLQYLTIDAPNGVLIDGGEQPDLRNTIIANRLLPGTGNGLEEKTLGRAYPYNSIFGFKNTVVSCSQAGGPIVNADPRFVGGSPEFSYALRADSPLINASDKGGEIGAYGNPD